MEGKDVVFNVVYSLLLLANFLLFLYLAVYLSRLKNFKKRLKMMYKVFRALLVTVSVVSAWLCLAIWKTKFPMEVTDMFKLALLLLISGFTGFGSFLYYFRHQIFDILNSRHIQRV